jgi:pantetheine-phosphate adenylyltransferase
MNRAVFPGSFDPFTKGHEEVVHQALCFFDEVVVAMGENMEKQSFFNKEKRIAHIRSLFPIEHVSIQCYTTLTTTFCHLVGAKCIVRGLRDSKDFEYERSIAHMNKTMSGIETVFLLTSPESTSINARIVREIYKHGGDITPFVTNAHLLV